MLARAFLLYQDRRKYCAVGAIGETNAPPWGKRFSTAIRTLFFGASWR